MCVGGEELGVWGKGIWSLQGRAGGARQAQEFRVRQAQGRREQHGEGQKAKPGEEVIASLVSLGP